MLIEIRSKCFSLLPLVGGGGGGGCWSGLRLSQLCLTRTPYLAHQLKFIKCEDML